MTQQALHSLYQFLKCRGIKKIRMTFHMKSGAVIYVDHDTPIDVLNIDTSVGQISNKSEDIWFDNHEIEYITFPNK